VAVGAEFCEVVVVLWSGKSNVSLWGARHRDVLLFFGRDGALEPGRKGKCSPSRRQ
jgi:hypothetical protein